MSRFVDSASRSRVRPVVSCQWQTDKRPKYATENRSRKDACADRVTFDEEHREGISLRRIRTELFRFVVTLFLSFLQR
jgi:hypothetical protein